MNHMNNEVKVMTDNKSKAFYGSVKVGERGQIVIPKKARDEYDINAGDSLIVFGDDKKVIKIMKADMMRDFALKVLEELDNNE
jgi:AbrB family looped-hinge helix DNA binding protein